MGQDYKFLEKLTANKARYSVEFAEKIVIELDKLRVSEVIEMELGAIPGPDDTFDDYTIDLHGRFLKYLEDQKLIKDVGVKASTVEYDSDLDIEIIDMTVAEDVWIISFAVPDKTLLKEFLSKFIFAQGYFHGHKITYKNGNLSINNQTVQIRKGSKNDGDKLLDTLSKDFSREWSTEEILEDWNIDILDDSIPKQKIIQASEKINKKVKRAFGIDKFLIAGTERVRVNRNL